MPKAAADVDPSQPLRNARHEAFAQLILKGLSQSAAYREIYPKSKDWKEEAVWVKASELAGKVSVRITDLIEKASTKNIMSVARRKELLSKTAEETLTAKMCDYLHGGKDGTYISYGPDSPNQGAVQELTTFTQADDDGDSMTLTTKIKLHGKSEGISAIDTLNKMDRIYKDENAGQNLTFNIIVPWGRKKCQPKK